MLAVTKDCTVCIYWENSIIYLKSILNTRVSNG